MRPLSILLALVAFPVLCVPTPASAAFPPFTTHCEDLAYPGSYYDAVGDAMNRAVTCAIQQSGWSGSCSLAAVNTPANTFPWSNPNLAASGLIYCFDEQNNIVGGGAAPVFQFDPCPPGYPPHPFDSCSTAPQFFLMLDTTVPERGACDGSTSQAGCAQTPEPINIASGNEHLEEVDYRSGDGRLTLIRSYNSADDSGGSLGVGWIHNHEARRIKLASAWNRDSGSQSRPYASVSDACSQGLSQVAARLPNSNGVTAAWDGTACQLSDGRMLRVYATAPNSGGISIPIAAQRDGGALVQFECALTCAAPAGSDLHLTRTSAGYQITNEVGDIETYDQYGVLTSLVSRGGYTITYAYDGGTGRLQTVTDSFGRALTFHYTSDLLQLVSVDTPDGAIQYSYDLQQPVTKVTYQDNTARTFVYAQSIDHRPLLTAVKDENGQTYQSIDYDSQGRAYHASLAGGAWASSVNFSSPLNPAVTDALGVSRTYGYSNVNGRPKIGTVSGQCDTCGVAAATTYDSSGYYESMTDHNGNVTRFVFDPIRGLLTSKTEAYGTALARTTSITWHPTLPLPLSIAEPGRLTTMTYDSRGDMLTRSTQDLATGEVRTWTFTYNGAGDLLTIDGPRTDVSDVTAFTYYSCSSGSQCGQLQTSTDALGHVTTFNSYDASGRPLQITDPNGVVTTFTYDQRGRIKTVAVGGATTTYDYYPTGDLKKVTFADGTFLRYTYDDAHRLIEVRDALNNTIHYTLDAIGTRTAEDIRDASGIVRKTQSQIVSSLGRVQEIHGANGQLTSFAYDSQGNRTAATEASIFTTGFAFDALNRLYQITDASSAITHYDFDALDRISAVTDPKVLVTHYTRNAFGDVTKIESPDTGTTLQTFDTAGNLLTKTDARGIKATYTYDALNRLTSISYPNTAENVTYSYDGSNYPLGSSLLPSTLSPYANAIGHLTGIKDQSGTTTLTYDPRGTLHAHTWQSGSASFTTMYAYNGADRQTGLTYPSGRQVTYNLDAAGQISAVSMSQLGTTTTLASGILHVPFGGWTQRTLGNGIVASRGFDQDYRINGVAAGTVLNRSYTFDARDNITRINDAIASSKSQDFGYDSVSRLGSAVGIYGTQGFTYDPNGNRIGTGYTYALASNRMTASPGVAWAYDAAGNATQMGSTLLDRNNAGRLATVRTPVAATLLAPAGFATTATYTYGANGQRSSKSVGNSTTQFVHDQGGALIAEASGSGVPQRDYVYVDGELLSIVDPPSCALALTCSLGLSAERVYYVHADHLGTPQVATTSSGSIAWSADYQPFGSAATTVSSIAVNLRLPGQYLDGETGLFQNWYRDYEPKSGRYGSFDPLGLSAGVNGYAYSFSAPLLFTDQTGLWAWGDPVPQFAVNVTAGFGDGVSSVLTLGLLSTSRVRSIFGIDGGVQQCSTSYRASKYAGFAWGIGTMWAAGLNGGSQSVFWSGYRQGARGVAESLGGTTLESTPIGATLDYVSNSLGVRGLTPVWKAASATFAANASGRATAVILANNPASIWQTIEAPILAARGIPVVFH